MRALIVAFGLTFAGCITVEPNMDASLQSCADATAGIRCLRGPVPDCDPDDHALMECESTPPCGCACPPGYAPESECGG